MEPGPPGQQGPGWSPLPAYVRLASPVSSCLGFRSVQCDNRAGQQDTNVKKTHPVSWQIPVEGVESGRDRQRETAKQCSWQQVPGWKQPLKEDCSPVSASVNIVTPNRASLVPHTVKNLPAMQEIGFDPWVEKILRRKEWLPTPVFLSGESHGQRSLVGYSPCDRKESNMAE